MANPSLTQIAKLGASTLLDPLLSFKWVGEFLPTINGHTLKTDYLESVDLPFNNITIADNWYGGSGYTYYAGPHDISSFSATFYEDRLGSTMKWLLQWKQLVKNLDTGIYNLPSVYKKSLRVLMLDSKNTPILRSEMTGIWPADTGNLSLNYTDGGRIVITQTFSCDNQILTSLV